MKIEVSTKGGYQILRIKEELAVIADLSELRYLVRGYIRQGKRHIAVSFTDSSYIYSGALAVLVECCRELKEGDGELCIIEPNQEIKDIIYSLNLDKVLTLYETVDDLPG